MTRLLVLPALVVLTLAGGWRSLGVGHLSDDWVMVSHVSRKGSMSSFTEPWLGMGEKSVLWHRPLFTALYDVDYRLFGVDPLPAHVHHLLWHALAVCLLYGIVRRLGGNRGAAFFGALLFAWHPYLAGTTGWLAARCGTVSGTLTLLCVLAWLHFRACSPGRGTLLFLTSLIAAIAAALTQESGYLALIVPLTIDVFHDRPRRELGDLVRTHALFALCGVGLLGLRWVALGTFKGGYPFAQGILVGGEAATKTLEDLGEALLRVPGAAPPEFLWGGLLLPVIAAVVTLSVFLAGRGTRWRPGALRMLIILALTQVTIFTLVSDTVLAPTTGQRWYTALGLWCGVLAWAASPMLKGKLLLLPCLLIPLHLAGYLQVQDVLVRGRCLRPHGHQMAR